MDGSNQVKSTKILHLSTYDFGGAGKAAYRLHCSLRSAGFKSKMAILKKKEHDDDVVEIANVSSTSRILSILSKAWLKITSNEDYYFQYQSRSLLSSPGELVRSLDFAPDVIIVHWVSNFISTDDIRAISLAYRAPVIWYLLDMAPLTGGCHYAWDCTGYFRDCGTCPALSSTNNNDLSNRILQKKQRALQDIDLYIVAGSCWLEKQARNSSLFNKCNISKLLLAVDPVIFSPRSKTIARQKLGLPEHKKIIFFGNQGLKLKRKGMSHLIEALQILAGDSTLDINSVLVAVAGITPEKLHMPLDYQALGFLENDEKLALAYQAADIFVCSSIEDSGPMMINESIMCGTPVVCFEMGVAQDLVHTGTTGYRAKLGDSRDLAHGMLSLLTLSEAHAMEQSKSCREIGMKLCHPQQQISGLQHVIEEIIKRQTNKCGLDQYENL